jgi:hypothetical protein
MALGHLVMHAVCDCTMHRAARVIRDFLTREVALASMRGKDIHGKQTKAEATHLLWFKNTTHKPMRVLSRGTYMVDSKEKKKTTYLPTYFF